MLGKYFKLAIEKKVSDLHLIAGSVPVIRVDGSLLKIGEKVLKSADIKKHVYAILNKDLIAKFEKELDLDFSYEFAGFRFRINFHNQTGRVALAARLILSQIPNAEDRGFTDVFYDLTRLRDGLILVTGPTGSGKSTTLATMIDIINSEREEGAHIITIEDPIEYMFKNNKAIIEQREVGRDTTSFHKALKYALRQDPNVIMVGEMRDLETMSAALTAAETGHLVLSTLHTNTAPETIDRIVDSFPAYQQKQILVQLSAVLRAVISQQLLPKVGGGRVVAHEIMIGTNAVSSLIRSNKSVQIASSIQTGQKDGMITMQKTIEKLLKKGLIDTETANKYRPGGITKKSYY